MADPGAGSCRFESGRRDTLRTMHSAAMPQAQSSGIRLIDTDSQPTPQLVGVSAAWRKLLMQVDRAAPHVQVAAIEGENGTGKQALARYLFSRSAPAGSSFQRRDAREWLVTDADPSTLTGFIYLDRVDLLATTGQGLLLSVLKAMQDRPSGRAVILASSQTSLREMAAQGLRYSGAAPAPRRHRTACPVPARQARQPLSTAARCARARHAGLPAATLMAGQCA
jgi:hypothetical protein